MHALAATEVLNRDGVGPGAPLYIDRTPSQEDLAQAASRWHQLDFTPEEDKEWTDAIDIHAEWQRGAELAEEWRSRGFAPEEARCWVQGDVAPGDDAEHSRGFRDANWHYFDVWTLYCFLEKDTPAWTSRRDWTRLPITHALNCARAGLTPHAAEGLLGKDAHTLELHLAELFEGRGRIDPFVAMLFNHHQWQASGCDDSESDCPFYARRLWDLHDEADDKARSRGEQPPYGGPYARKPRWRITEEREERERAEANRPKPQRCANSGGRGELEFRDGMEDWYVHCPECGVTWMGGNGDPLPTHNRPLGR